MTLYKGIGQPHVAFHIVYSNAVNESSSKVKDTGIIQR